MNFFYNIGIFCYTLAIHIAAPFNKKAKLWVTGRKGLTRKIKEFKRGDERLIWFHASSLGEFEQGRPVIETLKEKEKGTKILLTFFSPSGYEVRKDYQGADYIFYLPADTPQNAKRFIKHIRPDAAVFIKYEFWYNYLKRLHKHNIPVYLISAIFRQEQSFFKFWGKLYREMLHYFKMLFVQDNNSVQLLKSIGISNTQLTGDTRFDRVKQIADSAQTIEKIDLFYNEQTIVCGSTWPADEDILFEYINNAPDKFKWIIAPHEIGESHIKNIIAKSQKKIAKFSDNESLIKEANILIIDCIGLLSAIYKYGSLSYIGGGFSSSGIHNTLEAAVYHIPVIFGPVYQKFNEAVQLIEQGGAFSIKDKNELKNILDKLLTDPAVCQSAGEKSGEYVKSQLGATEAILKYLLQE